MVAAAQVGVERRVDERVLLLARAQGKSAGAVRREMTPGQLEALSQQLKREKALELLLGTPTSETEGED